MNIQDSINSRCQAIFNAYEINDSNIIEKINDLFSRIEEFGKSCTDVMDFESKFSSSNLNQEYIDLFTEIGMNCSPKSFGSDNSDVKSDKEYLMDDIKSEIKYQADSLSQPIRHKMYQETYDKVRDVPVVGEALNVKQHFDFFSKFRKKKD